MALNPTLPQWLTQTPDPSSIIARGSSAGGQAADARLAAERVMVQQNQFAQEIALREAAAQREAQQQAALQADRQQEREIQRTLAESTLAQQGRMAAKDMMTAQQKARQSAEALALKGDMMKQKYVLDQKKQEFDALQKQLDRTATGEQAAADRLSRERIADKKTKEDPNIKKLELEVAGKEAELEELSKSTSSSVVEQAEKVRSKLVNLRAQLKVARGGTEQSFTKGQQARQDGKLYEYDGTSWQEVK